MTRLILAGMVVAWCCTCATGQTDSETRRTIVTKRVIHADGKTLVGAVTIRGERVNPKEPILECHGRCELVVGEVVVYADELQFNTETGEASASGKMRVSFGGGRETERSDERVK